MVEKRAHLERSALTFYNDIATETKSENILQKTLPTSHIKVYHLHRYNKIASRVQKKRTKRSSRKNTEKHDKENKHRARKKRQATTSVSFGLGKNNTYFRQLLYPVFQTLILSGNCINKLSIVLRNNHTT